ncbi:phosphoribosyltransferase family protein [Asanoa sp. NPDC049573]|uniref:phosphoribosyltransferase family protein n=1 Tax=Asanoa sp. NPDC049573 TaxID=3155396 RepID=UPI003425F6F4
MTFQDRVDAGRRLARRLSHLRGCDAVVLGVARGGVPVAFEVAGALDTPLDVVVTERVADPFLSGQTIGALAEGGVRVFDASALRRAGIAPDNLDALTKELGAGVDRRARAMRAGRAPLSLAGRTAVIVDDGVATAASARAAARAVRARGAGRVVLAVPVAAADVLVGLADEIEETVCVERCPWMTGISGWYRDFPSVTDREVAKIVRTAGMRSPYREPRPEHRRGPTPVDAPRAA